MSYIPPEILIIHHWHHFWKELELIYRRDFSHSVKISSHKPFYDWNKFTFHEMMKPSNLNILWSKKVLVKTNSFYLKSVPSLTVEDSRSSEQNFQIDQNGLLISYLQFCKRYGPQFFEPLTEKTEKDVSYWQRELSAVSRIYTFLQLVEFNIKFSDRSKLDFQLIWYQFVGLVHSKCKITPLRESPNDVNK